MDQLDRRSAAWRQAVDSFPALSISILIIEHNDVFYFTLVGQFYGIQSKC